MRPGPLWRCMLHTQIVQLTRSTRVENWRFLAALGGPKTAHVHGKRTKPVVVPKQSRILKRSFCFRTMSKFVCIFCCPHLRCNRKMFLSLKLTLDGYQLQNGFILLRALYWGQGLFLNSSVVVDQSEIEKWNRRCLSAFYIVDVK